MQLQPLFPDVLGTITGGTRIGLDRLQVAVGVFPPVAFINQPVEIAIVLQNMVDQNMQVRVAIRVPDEDRKGNPVVIEVPRTQVQIGMNPGEVGVLRMPIIAHPPTRPGPRFPVRVAVRYRTPKPGKYVRPPAGGAPPSVLAVSPFHLQALREIRFDAHTWNKSAEIITTYFDIAPKRIPRPPTNFKHSYLTLWTPDQMAKEAELAQAQVETARNIAVGLMHPSAYWNFLDVTPELFAQRGMPLHPGEAKAIAKMMAYTVDEAPSLEPNYQLERTRWFQGLCQVLAQDPERAHVDRGELFTEFLYEAVLHDAVIMGFHVVKHRVQEDLGTMAEQVQYANRVLTWFGGYSEPDLNYIYLPLVLGGVAINRLVQMDRHENPWVMLNELNEARRGRIRLAHGETVVVFDMLSELLAQEQQKLREQRISPP